MCNNKSTKLTFNNDDRLALASGKCSGVCQSEIVKTGVSQSDLLKTGVSQSCIPTNAPGCGKGKPFSIISVNTLIIYFFLVLFYYVSSITILKKVRSQYLYKLSHFQRNQFYIYTKKLQ